MVSGIEERTRHFYRWARRGLGWQSYPYPVSLEPPFAPFQFVSHTVPVVDDSKHHTILSAFLERFSKGRPAPAPVPTPEIKEPEAEPSDDGDPVELRVLLPQNLSIKSNIAEGFLKSLAAVHTPMSFDLVGSGGRVSV